MTTRVVAALAGIAFVAGAPAAAHATSDTAAKEVDSTAIYVSDAGDVGRLVLTGPNKGKLRTCTDPPRYVGGTLTAPSNPPPCGGDSVPDPCANNLCPPAPPPPPPASSEPNAFQTPRASASATPP